MHKLGWVLVDEKTGQPVTVNTMVGLAGRDTMVKLVGGNPPHKFGSTGFVFVEYPDAPRMGVVEYYAGVIGCKWVKENRV
jgi:hypothetical protein